MLDLLDVPFGKRKIGCWDQTYVSSKDEIYQFIEEHFMHDPVGISMCAYDKGVPRLLFLPFDFDSESDIYKAWKDAKTLYNVFLTKGYTTMIVFSGQKGFHVYVKTVPKPYSRIQIRKSQESFLDMYGLKTMDRQVIGQINRLMRVPGTYNKGNLCRILAHSDGIDLDLDTVATSSRTYKPIEVESSSDEVYEFPCINKLIHDKEFWLKNHPRGDYEPSQIVRFQWVVMRKSEGKTSQEILEEAESYDWNDFNSDRTNYQISTILGKDYKPYSCNTLKKNGYCIIKDCPKNITNKTLKELGI